jgi:NO-binding membrane sensor protein with MHYT domain
MNAEKSERIKKFSVVLAFALLAQGLCWGIMIVGQAITSIENTLIAHAIGAPIIAIVVSSIYYRRFNYTTPWQTAIVFVSVVIAMDVFVVALLIEKSFEMFTSPIGTWIPISSIFLATYLTGLLLAKRAEAQTATS